MPRNLTNSSFTRRRRVALVAAVGLFILSESSARAITILIDYTYDVNNFFSTGSAERDRLEDATGFFETLIADDLDAITPTGNFSSFTPESWQITFSDPGGGPDVMIDDVAIAADTVVLYVGSQNLTGRLAEAGPGGYNSLAFPDSTFDKAVKTRGETGVGTTDFAPWGGSLSVDDATTWDTSLLGSGSDPHLYSTLLHEVGHVMGIGTAASWDNQVTLGEFTGTESVAEHGGNVPLYQNPTSLRYDHWAANTMSDIYTTTTPQEASLDPDILAGTVKLFTDLDVAGLDDIGWDIAVPVPEPNSGTLVVLLAGSLYLRRRRR